MSLKRFKKKTYPSYQLGQRGPGGGVIFLTPSSAGNPTGQYFEVATNMFAGDPEGLITYKFVVETTRPSGLNLGGGIGQGKRNTRVLNQTFPNSTGTCLSFIKSFRQGNHSDWYIPSKDEFSAILELDPNTTEDNYLLLAGSGGTLIGWGQWALSSEPSGATTGLDVYYIGPFEAGFFVIDQFDPNFYVMPVRSFYPYGV